MEFTLLPGWMSMETVMTLTTTKTVGKPSAASSSELNPRLLLAPSLTMTAHSVHVPTSLSCGNVTGKEPVRLVVGVKGLKPD
jgi:hypothetical protein